MNICQKDLEQLKKNLNIDGNDEEVDNSLNILFKKLQNSNNSSVKEEQKKKFFKYDGKEIDNLLILLLLKILKSNYKGEINIEESSLFSTKASINLSNIIESNNKIKEKENFILEKNIEHNIFPEEKKNEVKTEEINNISLILSKTENLINNEGWEIKENLESNFEITNNNGLIIGFLGDYSEGKTYYLNKIFNRNLPLKPTDSIKCYFLKNTIRVIDTPGTNKPQINDENLKKNVLECKFKDFIIEKFILDNSIITIIIINSFNLKTQKKLEKIKKIVNDNYLQTSVMKSIYIIHNLINLQNESEYNEYINYHFNNKNFFNKDNIIFTEKFDNNIALKFEVLHFIPKFYEKKDEVIERIKTQIFSHIQIPLINFNEMIENTFNKIGEKIFNIKNSKLEISNNKIFINNLDKKEEEEEEEIEEEKKYKQLINFNKSIAFNSFKINIPSYTVFIDDNKELIVQIELVGYKSVRINYKPVDLNYVFHVIAKRATPEEKKNILLNTRNNEDLEFEFKIPVESFNFSSPKYYEQTSEKGLITFKYKGLELDNDD
jgi:hypothetical protein